VPALVSQRFGYPGTSVMRRLALIHSKLIVKKVRCQRVPASRELKSWSVALPPPLRQPPVHVRVNVLILGDLLETVYLTGGS
jgi:hypothetical protein